ncbi:hypothetical protein AB0M39_08150 [Streptomyces sp. NPDC051907]|uniref:hypothetical protein n=1 Tax=Streptomyces sp. NPDC051907 TaxID=3155284 RepID=UPI00341292EE
MPVQENTDLKSQYADKVAADLDQNTAEQGRIRAELEALQTQLATLEQDHLLLQRMSDALAAAKAVPETETPATRHGGKPSSAPAAEEAPKKPAAKTATAKKPAAKKAAAKRAPAAPAPAAAKQKAVKKPAATKQTTAKTTGGNGPALADLIHAHLSSEDEPRTAGEIAKALAAAHPGRNVNDNLVRTTTERLVARSRVERAKQGSTVYYTALPASAAPSPDAAGGSAAAAV